MWRTIWDKEPVAITNALRLVLLAAMTFGWHVSHAQLVTSLVAVEAVLTLFTRSQVTPTSGATAPPMVDLSKIGKP